MKSLIAASQATKGLGDTSRVLQTSYELVQQSSNRWIRILFEAFRSARLEQHEWVYDLQLTVCRETSCS